MFRIASRLAFAAVVLALGLAQARAEEEKKKEEKKDKPAFNPAAKKMDRDVGRHREFLKRIKASKGQGDVIFLGDSITQGWEGNPKVWKKHFGEFKPVNLGIGGDQTGHVLWRITDGKELADLKPKVAVIMIGTNNVGGYTNAHIAGGIKAIIDELKSQKPDIKILLLGVFPRGSTRDADKETKVIPAAKLNRNIKEINDIISKYDDGKTVIYKDIGPKFLDKDGGLSLEVMNDALHLTAKGYEIWGEAITPDIEKLLK
jgi:lysophospholipase L1-like esterase